MNLNDWTERNQGHFGSVFESIFAKSVLPLVPDLNFDAVSVQFPFFDGDGKQRYCDFVIRENDAVRIAIEIDGFDKTGSGQGMSHDEFIDWQRRQASLTSQGWYVLRFANRDVEAQPERCAAQIGLLLTRLRAAKPNNFLDSPGKQSTGNATTMRANTSSWKRGKNFAATFAIATLIALMIFALWQKSDQPAKTLVAQELSAQPYYDRAIGERGEVGVGRDRIEEVMSDEELRSEILAAGQRQSHAEFVLPPEPAERNSGRAMAGRGEVGVGRDRIEEVMDDDEVSAEILAARQRQLRKRSVPTIGKAGAPGVAPHHMAEIEGQSCSTAISWRNARQFVGRTVAVDGPVVKITRRESVRGSPTWIDMGAPYPSENRLVLVAWGRSGAGFPAEFDNLAGKNICAIGKIFLYKGTAQIELSTASQIKLML